MQSFLSWWKNTQSREEQSRPCTKRCLGTPLAAVSTWNTGPKRHGWVNNSVYIMFVLDSHHTTLRNLLLDVCDRGSKEVALVFNCFMFKKKKKELIIFSALVYPCLSAGSQLEVAVRCHSSGHRQRGVICGHSCQKLNWACNDNQTKLLKQRGTCGVASQRLNKEGANAVQSVASSQSLHCHSHCVATLLKNRAWQVINHQRLRWTPASLNW